jgi:2-oxoglutarate dehydrogenase E2 component (dihydrolipoamide succinyltransferase)
VLFVFGLQMRAQVAPVASAAPAIAQMINQGGGFVPPVPGVGFGSFKVPPYRAKPGDQVVPFTRRRRITADHMVYSKIASPHVVTVAECDLQRAAKLREANKDRYKKEGMSLTMLAFVVVAVARAIRENPTVNARVLDDSFVIFKDVNLGVAVDSPDGLVVPVVRRADELGVRGIVRSIVDVAGRARTGKITVDDLSGAPFSVSNPGLKGNLFGGAIINQPNVGILRIGDDIPVPYDRFREILQDAQDAVLFGNASPKKALADAQRSMDTELDRYNLNG